MISKEKLKELAVSIKEVNVKNGWWEENRDSNDLVLLIKSELLEAFECYRNGQLIDNKQWWADYTNTEFKKNLAAKEEQAIFHFRTHYKETIGMEVADTIIRILDAMEAFNIPYMDLKRVEVGNKGSLSFFIKADQLIHSLYGTVFNKEAINQFAVILQYLFSYDEKMIEYIEVKTLYNSTRGYKHGNKKA